MVDLNGTRAAIAAGYSDRGADVAAVRLLAKASVRRLIDQLNSKRATKLEIKAERVVEELARMALANMHDYVRVDADGRPTLDLSGLDRDKFAAIQEIKEDTTGGNGDGERRLVLRTTFRLSDKTKSLELLGRHLGMFNDKLNVTGLEGLADTLATIRRKKNEANGDR